MNNNKRFSNIGRLAGLLLVLAAAFSGAVRGSDDDRLSITPFSRVAVIDPVVDGTGDLDFVATDVLAKQVATAIATYVATVNDVTAHGFPADWILGGYEGSVTIEQAILRIPTPYPIDPDEPVSTANRKKVNIIEMCNPLFAKKALGVLPVVDSDPTTLIANGYIHAPALPCEVSVYVDEVGNINVEMLNPEAIFTLFFTDVLFGDQMTDPDFAEAIVALPATVNGEIQTIIKAALVFDGIQYTPSAQPLGPLYKSLEEVAEVVEDTPYESPYVHFAYKKRDGSDFSDTEVKYIAEQMIETLTLDGIHPRGLDAQLNFDDWRSARPLPLPIPGNWVIEACSPTNAIAAMGLGLEHATALPCEIAIKAVSYDGITGNETLLITYLDPHFMFSALFSDAFDELTEDELEAFLDLPPVVLEDLQTIVANTLKWPNLREMGIRLTRPRQLFFDMLPGDTD